MNIADLWKYDLRKGSSDHPANGACLFDAGMWLVYGRIGDNPPCSCPIIRSYAIGLNDNMDDVSRQLLRPFILRVVGNRDPEAEPARLHHIVLETARRVVPLAIERKWPEHAAALRALPDDATYQEIEAAAYAANAAAAATTTWPEAIAILDGAAAYAAAYASSALFAYAAYATYAATSAASAAYAAWPEAIAILDGALRIGKQSPEYDETEVRAAIKAFDLASHLTTA